MKKIFIILFLCSSMSAFCQSIIMVDTVISMSRGAQPSIQIAIPQIKSKELKRDWLKYIGNSSKEKSVETKSENLLTEVFNSNISPGSFKIYSTILETNEGSKLTVWVTGDDVIFWSKKVNIDQHMAVQKYLYDFSFAEYQKVVSEELKVEINKSSDLEKELTKLINDYEKSLKQIADDERSIQQTYDEITTNDNDIRSLSSKIVTQKQLVDKTASDENANKGAIKTLKELENEKDNVQAKKEKNNKRIVDWNKDIRDNERNVADLIEKRSLKEIEISAQKDKVQTVQAKLDSLK